MDKKIRLPREGFIDDRNLENRQSDDEDVEGHGIPDSGFTVLPAPPSIGLRRSPGHGGELTADDEDVEGHRIPNR